MSDGIDQQEWNAGITAITSILSHRAKTMVGNETISYSELYNQIHGGIHSAPLIGPDDHRFHHMLGEVSTNEHRAGRGMLSVLVVHKTGDMRPGPGFFDLARKLGYAFKDEDAFWINMVNKVCVARREV
jgi:hypothetical protein